MGVAHPSGLLAGPALLEEALRHFETISRRVSRRAAISSLSRPASAVSTISTRTTFQ